MSEFDDGSTADTGHEHRHDDHVGELAEELRLLTEALLERVEPVLRRAAEDDGAEWSGCSWCPLCAAIALVRGEHHDVLSAVAEHGTAIVTVLREALAGFPVDPVFPHDGESGEGSADETAPAADDPPAPRSRAPGYVSIPVRINR